MLTCSSRVKLGLSLAFINYAHKRVPLNKGKTPQKTEYKSLLRKANETTSYMKGEWLAVLGKHYSKALLLCEKAKEGPLTLDGPGD